MIEFPAIGGDISAIEVGAAVVMFAVGYLTHELMHLAAVKLLGEPYDVRLFEDGLTGALIGGTGVSVTMTGTPTRVHAAVVALAPIIMALAPLAGIALALSYPVVDIGTMLVLGAWFAASIPGLQDWVMVLSYRPERGIPTEVNTDGS